MILLFIILSTLAGGLLSALVAGLLLLGVPQRWMSYLIGFATGVLLAVAFMDMLPEAFESGVEAQTLFTTLLIGLLAFYGLERIALWRHAHPDEEGHDHHCPSHGHHHAVNGQAVFSVMLGDAFHNFVDGVLLAAAFLTSPALGWSSAFAVVAHEIPHEAGNFAILRASGMSVGRALFFNTLASLASVLGGLIGYFALAGARAWLPYVLVLASASFMYIAISDLLPLLRRELHRAISIGQTICMLIGIALICVGTITHAH